MITKRNLIIVLCHGLRSDALGDSRAWPLSTPNLQKLWERGLRLTATCACPADVGGLVSLFTGLHARQHGYVDQVRSGGAIDEFIGLTGLLAGGWPGRLAEAGYHVAGVGWIGLIEPWLHEASFIDSVEALSSPRCRYLEAMREKGYDAAILQQRRQRLRVGPFEPDRLILDTAEDIDGFTWLEARRMLDRMPPDRPWALTVVTSGPGNDLPPPTLYDYVVAPEGLNRGFTPADLSRIDTLAELDYPRAMLQRMDGQQVGRIRADYLGRVCLLDQMVGQLMGQLQDRPDAQRTWVLLASDRGQLLGEHGAVGHRSFLSGGVEVPVIVAPPWSRVGVSQVGVRPGAELVSTVDVAATIGALGGCDLPKASTGWSLVPLLAGEAVHPPRSAGVISEYGQRLMVRAERYKAVFDVETMRVTTLFDLQKDPDERINLAGSAVAQNVTDAMRWRLGEALMPLRAAKPSALPQPVKK